MSEPIMADDRAVGPPERLHPLFLVTGLGRSLRGLAGGYAAIGYLAVSGRARMAIIGAVLLLAGLAASVLLHWLRFSFRIGDSEIRIDSGIISRTHRSIPFDRVQDVDISQGLLGRLFGIARVKFETGGATAGGKEEGVLHAIPFRRAEEIRHLVRARRATSADAPAFEPSETEQPPVFAMPLPRVILAGVFNFSLALFAGLFGLTQTFGDVMGFDPFNRRFWQDILSAGSPLADYVLDNRAFAAVAGLLVLVGAGLLTGIVRTLLRDYGFTLERTDAGLRRRRGLLTKTDVTLPSRRAQAAILATGPVRDRFGWREVRLQSLASDEGGKSDHVLAPLATSAEAEAVLDALGWPAVPADIVWQRVARTHVAILAVGLAPLLIAAAGAAMFLPVAAAPLIAVYFAAIGSRWLSWGRTGWAIDRGRLLVRSGWWRRRIVILPVDKIQSIDLVESALSRAFGLAGLAFGVAGGGPSGHRLAALRRETARELRARLLA